MEKHSAHHSLKCNVIKSTKMCFFLYNVNFLVFANVKIIFSLTPPDVMKKIFPNSTDLSGLCYIMEQMQLQSSFPTLSFTVCTSKFLFTSSAADDGASRTVESLLLLFFLTSLLSFLS